MFNKLRKSRFARDAATLQVAAGVTSMGNLASTMALAFLLGARLQGTFYLAMALYSLFYLLGNVGLSTVTVSHVAKAIGADDRGGVIAWLGFLLKASSLLSLVMLGLAFLILPPVAHYFYEDPRVGEWAIALCFLPLLEIPRVVCAAALQGTRRMKDLAQLENSVEATRVLLIVSLILITGRAEGAIWGTLAAGLAASILALILYRRARRDESTEADRKSLLPSLKEIVQGTRALPLREGLPQGIQVGFMRNVDALVLDVAPTLIMGYFAGPASAAYFRIAQRFLRLPLMLLQGISRTAVPAFSNLIGQRDLVVFRQAFYRATLFGGGMIALGLLVAVPLVPFVTRTFFPHDYWDDVPFYTYILAAGFAVTGFSGALESFYIATDRVGVALRIGFGLGFPCIVLMFVGGLLFGSLGVAVGMSLTMMVGLCHHAYIAWYFRRNLKPGGGSSEDAASVAPQPEVAS